MNIIKNVAVFSIFLFFATGAYADTENSERAKDYSMGGTKFTHIKCIKDEEEGSKYRYYKTYRHKNEKRIDFYTDKSDYAGSAGLLEIKEKKDTKVSKDFVKAQEYCEKYFNINAEGGSNYINVQDFNSGSKRNIEGSTEESVETMQQQKEEENQDQVLSSHSKKQVMPVVEDFQKDFIEQIRVLKLILFVVIFLLILLLLFVFLYFYKKRYEKEKIDDLDKVTRNINDILKSSYSKLSNREKKIEEQLSQYVADIQKKVEQEIKKSITSHQFEQKLDETIIKASSLQAKNINYKRINEELLEKSKIDEEFIAIQTKNVQELTDDLVDAVNIFKLHFEKSNIDNRDEIEYLLLLLSKIKAQQLDEKSIAVKNCLTLMGRLYELIYWGYSFGFHTELEEPSWELLLCLNRYLYMFHRDKAKPSFALSNSEKKYFSADYLRQLPRYFNLKQIDDSLHQKMLKRLLLLQFIYQELGVNIKEINDFEEITLESFDAITTEPFIMAIRELKNNAFGTKGVSDVA